ncbi:MAG: hypothetical protein V1694_01350 [Candidatus Eisenbacteria bacterium]
MDRWKIVAQWPSGLVIAEIGIVAVLMGLLAFASLSPAQARDSLVTNIEINDEGIKVGDTVIKSHEGVITDREGEPVRGRVSGDDVVRFGDDVIIDEDQVVQGDAVSIFGSVLVNGVVEGDAVAVGGGLSVGPRGRVDGDGVAIGGGVTKEPGGVIRGQMVSIGKGGHYLNGQWFPHARHFPYGVFSRTGRLVTLILWTLLLILLALLVTAVARRHVGNVCVKAKKDAFLMGLIGLGVEVLIIPIMILFCITIIGIPIGIVVIPLLFGLALLLGYTGVGLAVGERIANGSGKSPYWSVAMGVLMLQALVLISGLVRLPGGPLRIIGWILAFLGWAVIYVAATVGLGSVIMTRFGTRAPKIEPQGPSQPPAPQASMP